MGSDAWAFAGHDIVEFLLRNLSILVLVSLLDHLLQLVLIDVLAQLLHDGLQVFDRDVARLVQVEEVKHLLQVFPRVLVRDSLGHQVQEFVEVDFAAAFLDQVGDDLEDGLVGGLGAERCQCGLQFWVRGGLPEGRMSPVRPVSKRSKASLISWISSEETPPRS